jgi:hypothetical protein
MINKKRIEILATLTYILGNDLSDVHTRSNGHLDAESIKNTLNSLVSRDVCKKIENKMIIFENYNKKSDSVRLLELIRNTNKMNDLIYVSEHIEEYRILVKSLVETQKDQTFDIQETQQIMLSILSKLIGDINETLENNAFVTLSLN